MKTGVKRLLRSVGVETLRSMPQRLLGAESGDEGRKKSRGWGGQNRSGVGPPQNRSGVGPPQATLPQRDTHTHTHTHTDSCRGRRLEETQARSSPGSERPPALGLSPQPGLGWAARQPPLSLCAGQQKGQKLCSRLAGGCTGDVSQEPFLPEPWMRACYTTDLRIIRGEGSAGEKAVQPPGTPQAMVGDGAGQVGPTCAWGLGPGSVWRPRGHLGAHPPPAPGRPDRRVLTPARTPGSQGPAWLLGVAGGSPEDPSVPCGPWGQKPQLAHKEAAFSVVPMAVPSQ